MRSKPGRASRADRAGPSAAPAHARPGRREQRYSVPQLRQSSCQPDHYALGAAVAPHRQATMEVEGDVHAAAMYRPTATLANGAVSRMTHLRHAGAAPGRRRRVGDVHAASQPWAWRARVCRCGSSVLQTPKSRLMPEPEASRSIPSASSPRQRRDNAARLAALLAPVSGGSDQLPERPGS